MSTYKRGWTWWYKFQFAGQMIRESAKTTSKTVAREAERARRRQLEEGFNGIRKRDRAPLLKNAADDWLKSKAALTPLGRAYYTQYVNKLKRFFGGTLLCDIGLDDIGSLQRKRKAEGNSPRTINCEVATLRQILKHFGLWGQLSGRVRFLRESRDVGKALSHDEESRLLEALAASPSPAVLPFFVLSLDAGLRPAEIRALRLRDLCLTWHQGNIVDGEIVVGQSKTEAGSGRVVPLTHRACAVLSLWFAHFPLADLDSYLFPFHHVGFAGTRRLPWVWGVDLTRPMTRFAYKRAFETARRSAEVSCRFYDARHTFVTRLAENPAVSVETIRQLAGHVSERMLSRYAHIRVQARRAAIATLEQTPEIEAARAQNRAQSAGTEAPVLN
jgi:integrase